MTNMAINKVVLINLPDYGSCADSFTPDYAIGSFSLYPPLGLLYVATAIKDDFPVEVMDVVARKLKISQIIEEIARKKPDVLGISCQTLRLYPMTAIINGVKSRLPGITIVIGGPHTSLYPVETLNLPGVDYVIVGDGEKPFKLLLEALSAGDPGMIKNTDGLVFRDTDGKPVLNRPNYQPIDGIKIPDRTLLNYDYYYTAADAKEPVVSMISSRGCPFNCIFCDVQEKTYRARSAGNVVDEMEYIAGLFKEPVIHIFDDNFNLRKDRVMAICSETERRNLKVKWTTRARVMPFDEEMVLAMKNAGLKRIHLGVESGSETSLRLMKKGINKEQIRKAFALCHKYDVDTLAYFIIGYSWETKKDINDTLKFIQEIFPSYIMANALYPVPKTEAYNTLLKTGKIKEDFWLKFVREPARNFRLPQYQNLKTKRYLKRKLDEIYLTFYLSPRFILKNMKETKKQKGMNVLQLVFRLKLAFLIFRSYAASRILELLEFRGGSNEIK